MPKGVYVKTKEHRGNLSKALKGVVLSEEHRRNLSRGQLKRYEDPRQREKHSERILKIWADPNSIYNSRDFRKAKKETTKKKWQDSEFVAKCKVGLYKANAKPEVKKKRSKAGIKKWQDLEYREKQIKALNRPEVKEKQRKVNLERWQIPEYREKTSKSITIALNRTETKEKMSKLTTEHWQDTGYRKMQTEAIRIGWEKRAESSGYPRNYLYPNFNLDSITIFKVLDKVLYNRGRYGGTKAGERKIGRYFVDYFNKKYQFIIEWNEPWHYDSSQLIKKDIKKREYILDKYPNHTYVIVKQDDWFKNGDLTNEVAIKIVDYILEKLRIKRKWLDGTKKNIH